MTIAPEFSRLISIEGLSPDKTRTDNIEATPAECAALAKRFDLRRLSGFKAKISVLRVTEGKIIKVKGDFEAEAVQSCVVSLQDVLAEIEGHFETFFTEDGKDFEEDEEMNIESDEELPDVVNNGMLDIGELTAQYLCLELEPYPRATGVNLAAQMAEVGGNTKNRPFQILQELKDKQDK